MNTYKHYRYPQVIISHAVWLYHRFTLSFRDIEELLACRGIIVTYETIRQWCLKITPSFAKSLRKKQGALGDQWFLDEVFVKINGKLHYLWRTVDQDGCELDILLTKTRDKKAAVKFFKKLFKDQSQQQRQMRQFISIAQAQAQRFLACHGVINNHFRQQRIYLKPNITAFLEIGHLPNWFRLPVSKI